MLFFLHVKMITFKIIYIVSFNFGKVQVTRIGGLTNSEPFLNIVVGRYIGLP